MADDIKDEFEKANEAQDKFSQNFKDSIDFLRDAIVGLGDRLNEALKNAIKTNDDLEDDIKRTSKLYTNDISKSLDKITVSLDNQYDLGTKISRGIDISKDILKEKDRLEKESEIIRRRLLVLQKAGINIDDKVNKILEERLNSAKIILKVLEDENKERTDSLGIVGKLAEGLDGVLKKISKSDSLSRILDLGKAVEKTREFAAKSKEPIGSFQKLGVLSKNVGSNLISGFKGIDFITIAIGQIVEAILHIDKAAGEIAKKLGISYSEAASIKGELTSIAASSSDIFLTTENLQKTFTSINESLGSRTRLEAESLKFLTLLGERAGYSQEVQTNLYKLQLLTGKQTKSITQEFHGQIGLLKRQLAARGDTRGAVLNEKQLLESINKISSSILFSLGGQGEELAKAVFHAKSLGVELDLIEKVQDSLLDFESSIQNQMEAQLFLGQEGIKLDAEKMRLAALTNDQATIASEINQQLGSLSKENLETVKHNVFAQQALAKHFGLSRNELTKMLMDREILQKLGAKEGQDLSSYYKELVKVHGEEKAAAIIKQKTGDETIANQLASVTMQEEFNQIILKLKEIFVSLAKPVLAIVKPIVDILAPALGFISRIVTSISQIMNSIYDTIVGIVNIITGDFTKGMHKIGEAGKSTAKLFISEDSQLYKKAFEGEIYNSIFEGRGQEEVEGNDVISPGYGKRTLLTPEGNIKLNDKDSVIAGTDLLDKSIEQTKPQLPEINIPKISLETKESKIQNPFENQIIQINDKNIVNVLLNLDKQLDRLIETINFDDKNINLKNILSYNNISKIEPKEEIKIIKPQEDKINVKDQEEKIINNNNNNNFITNNDDRDNYITNEKNENEINNINNDNKINNEINDNKVLTNNNDNKKIINKINNIENSNSTINENNISNNETLINEVKMLKLLFMENNKLLSQLLNKESIIEMDGVKVGETLSSGTGTFAIQ